MSIRQLPEDVASKIKSSAAITSLNRVVCGLLKNSLDASSAKVRIRLDYLRGSCTVEDDGLGIEPREFRDDGGLGKLHHTSRFPPSPRIHGGRGEFLASVASLSLLSLTSHHHRYRSQSFLSLHDSKVLIRQLPAPVEQRLETFSHGTRVSVHALFGSMPVRVKHQAAIMSTRAGVDKEWGHLVKEIVALLLAWPSEVSVFLSETSAPRELRLKSPATTDAVTRTSRLFVQASLADHEDSASWVPVSASARHVRIKGCISSSPVATRRSQIISLGIRPMLNDYDSNILYEAVNDVFRNSSFGVADEGEVDRTDQAGPRTKPRRCLERWPMFYLQVTLPSADMVTLPDSVNDSQRVLTSTVDLLKAVSYEFLKKQHMRPRAISKSSETASYREPRAAARAVASSKHSHLSTEPKAVRPSPRSPLPDSKTTRPRTPFDDWHHAKVGRASRMKDPAVEVGGRPQLRGQGRESDMPRLVGEGGKLLRLPFNDGLEASAKSSTEAASQPCPESLAAEEANEEEPRPDPDTNQERSDMDYRAEGRRGKTRVLGSGEKCEPSEWLQGVLRSWKNPVFEATESLIPSVCDGGPSTDPAHSRCTGGGDVRFDTMTMSLVGRLSRAALADAEVIAQVDCKFVLVRLPLQAACKGDEAVKSSGLVMIDQHAADERCRLEQLFGEYFEEIEGGSHVRPVVEALDRPVMFEATGREGELLERFREHLESWGVVYRVSAEALAERRCRIQVTHLPPSIMERCRSEPRLVIELMRKEVWALADGSVTPQTRDGRQRVGKSWASRFRGCPSGVLELLYSRSCRSAIMFNDELSREECERLVRRLAGCAFPFQCAHGRPTMAPLTELGPGGGRFGGDGQAVGADRWRRWMGRRGPEATGALSAVTRAVSVSEHGVSE